MACLNPILIYKNKEDKEQGSVLVRCRECEDCKQSARSSAYVRAHYEYMNCLKHGGMVFFFTLTFADEYVPFKFHRMCFDKKLVQKWLQKFRQRFRRYYGYSLKYLIVSELGHVGTHRPHHHGILCLYPDTTYQLKSWREGGENHARIPCFPATYCKIIEKLWFYGRCDIQELDPSKGGIRYVTKYIAKDIEEDSLFKDIFTRIQIRRGKGVYQKSESPNYVLKSNGKLQDMNFDQSYYYSHSFPYLFAFKQRYCAFTLISQNFGGSAPVTNEMLVSREPLYIDGFSYNIPRYYSDRYVRKELKASQEYYIDNDFKGFISEAALNRTYYSKEIGKWITLDLPHFCLPPKKVIEKNLVKVHDDLFAFHYELKCPYYKQVTRYDGKTYKVQVLPRQSECSMLSSKRRLYDYYHILDRIEDAYFALPPLLQNSCQYDIPRLLKDSKLFADEMLKDSAFSVVAISDLGVNVLEHLRELTLEASKWRAKSRIAKREQKRKEKEAMNAPYAKKPLTYEEYRSKSIYYKLF